MFYSYTYASSCSLKVAGMAVTCMCCYARVAHFWERSTPQNMHPGIHPPQWLPGCLGDRNSLIRHAPIIIILNSFLGSPKPSPGHVQNLHLSKRFWAYHVLNSSLQITQGEQEDAWCSCSMPTCTSTCTCTCGLLDFYPSDYYWAIIFDSAVTINA